MPKDKELADHERAHTGKPGSKARHGANATASNIEKWEGIKKQSTISGSDPYEDLYNRLKSNKGL